MSKHAILLRHVGYVSQANHPPATVVTDTRQVREGANKVIMADVALVRPMWSVPLMYWVVTGWSVTLYEGSRRVASLTVTP